MPKRQIAKIREGWETNMTLDSVKEQEKTLDILQKQVDEMDQNIQIL